MKNEETLFLFAKAIKSLIKKQPLDKITVTDIVSTAGKTRQTFYRHFQDKYEVLEWILKTEIKDKIQVLIDNNMEEDIFRLLCNCLEKDHAFYRKVYEITGQNSFEELMSDYIYHLFLQILSKYPLKAPDKLAILTIEAIARFYTFGLADSLKYWICQDTPFSGEEVHAAYNYIIRNSVLDLLEYPLR